jgi:hypothetical protein
MTVVLN